MDRIIGIDPGSKITGYGIIDSDGRNYSFVQAGCIKAGSGKLAQRLKIIHSELVIIINNYQPNEAAVEEVFMHTNAKSALVLGQARGAALVALTSSNLAIAEYSPRKIKQAVVGYGAATKAQIQHMIKTILKIPTELKADAADALAVAFCHANTAGFLQKIKEQK